MTARKPLLLYALALAAIHLAITLPLLNTGLDLGTDEFDYHYQTILNLRAHWPEIDFNRDLLSAVSPGYHYFLATVSLITGPGLLALRLVNDLVSLLLPLSLFFWLTCRVSPTRAFWLVLPVLLSNYFIKSSCRIMTDNVSTLFAVLTMACIFQLPARSWQGSAAGFVATAAVALRQLAVWLEIPLLAQPLLEYLFPPANSPSRVPTPRDLLFLLCRFLPLTVLVFLYLQWHGLVPPQWQSRLSTYSFASTAFILSMASLLGLPLLLSLGTLLTRNVLFSRWTLLAILAGLLLALLSPTSHNVEMGRWGGPLWIIVSWLPVVGDRSVFILGASLVGATVIAIFFQLIARNASLSTAWLWLSCVAGWAATYIGNPQVFQRYYEVQLLIFLVMAYALVIAPHKTWRPRLWPLALLALYFLGSLAQVIYLPLLSSAFGR
jgi:hypothetical protein